MEQLGDNAENPPEVESDTPAVFKPLTRNYRDDETREPPWTDALPKRLERPNEEEAEAHRDFLAARRGQRFRRANDLDEIRANAERDEQRQQQQSQDEPRQEQPQLDEPPEIERANPPGFRPPRDEVVCLDPPDLNETYRSVTHEQVATPPDEIWLYASGGGLRSPQAVLGTSWYLEHVDHWRYVTRFVSVSGGSITNAEFAARAAIGAAPGDPGSPSTLLTDFHRRLSTPRRWTFALLGGVMVSLLFVLLWALWKTATWSNYLVDQPAFRWAIGIVVLTAVLFALWKKAGTVGKFVLYLAVIAGLIGLVLLWFWLPWWAKLLLGGLVLAAALGLLWWLSGADFTKWLLAVVAFASGLIFLWAVVRFDARDDWRWLDWIVMIVMIVGFMLAYLLVLQLGIRMLLKYRLSKALEGPTPNPANLDEATSGLLHIISTADFRSGHPMYLSTGPLEPNAGRPAAVAVHDMSEPANAIHYYDATKLPVLDAVYSSAALPGLVLLHSQKFDRAIFSDPPFINGLLPLSADPGVVYGDPVLDHPAKGTFALLDGGLNSTLGTRLDPVLGGWLDRRGMMEIFDLLYPPANPGNPPVANHDVRRVVVDAGQYLSDPGVATTLATKPGLSAIFSLKRGIDIANLSLLASDRMLADRPFTDIWYLPTTGGDHAFSLRLTDGAIVQLGLASPNTDPLHDVILSKGRRAWFDIAPGAFGAIPPNLIGLAQSIDRVVLLKQRSDRVSLVGGVAEHGYDSLASGVASAFVEHQGLGTDPSLLERCLFDLDELLLADNPILRGQLTRRQRLPGKLLPLVVSHQGLRPHIPGAAQQPRGNTAAAFLSAQRYGFSMLEVDVMVTSDGQLAALHPGGPTGKHDADYVASNTFATLQGEIPDLVHLRQLLNPTKHADELFEKDPNAAAMAVDLAAAIWNIEAKDTASAKAVATLIKDLKPKPNGEGVDLQDRIIFSSGWRRRPMRAFRSEHKEIPTACHWGEAARWALGFRASEPKLVQPPIVEPNARWALPFVIRLLKRGVRVARSQGVAVLWFRVDHEDVAMTLRADVPCHGYMSEGTHVVDWAISDYW